MNNYETTAANFLKNTGTILTAKFTGYKKHFYNDLLCRDVFKITIKNNRHKYTFNFGQSINDSTKTGATPPDPYSVLSCITKYEVGTFFDFCQDFGYNIEDKQHFKIYKNVLKEWQNIEKLFTAQEIEILKGIN